MDLQAVRPSQTSVDARTLAGIATLLVAGILSLLHIYRRRAYILCWVSGWTLTGVSLLLEAHRFAGEKSGNAAYGVSQFISIVGALLFVLGADAYRSPLRLHRGYALVLLPLLIWFALAPIPLGASAAFGPGHLLVAGALGAAGVAHLALVRQTRLIGAIVAGLAFVLIAGSHVSLVLGGSNADAVRRSVLVNVAFGLVAALGMQLMTFEDMTYELRVANKRLESAQGELREMVTTDALTGCRNRRFFDEIIGREIQRHRRYRIPLSMLFIDVDRFKAINDTLGHEAGDRLLQRVAAFLIRNVREADYVFRWGGDEFLILISCREEEAARKGEDLQAAFAIAPEAGALPRGVGLSVGAAEVTEATADVMDVVKQADERMYGDKKRTGYR
jgi:diguanylate cyclase (GGDEF)-like protein